MPLSGQDDKLGGVSLESSVQELGETCLPDMYSVCPHTTLSPLYASIFSELSIVPVKWMSHLPSGLCGTCSIPLRPPSLSLFLQSTMPPVDDQSGRSLLRIAASAGAVPPKAQEILLQPPEVKYMDNSATTTTVELLNSVEASVQKYQDGLVVKCLNKAGRSLSLCCHLSCQWMTMMDREHNM